MQNISLKYKDELKKLGRQIRAKLWVYKSYKLETEDDNEIITENNFNLSTEQISRSDYIVIYGDDIYSIDFVNNGDILKSLMKQCNLNLKQNLEIGTTIEVIFELLIDEENNLWELVDYGDYIIYSKEYSVDTKSWNYTCYDGMLYAMKDYIPLNIEYPTTIDQYITALADSLGLPFANRFDEYTNYDKTINEDPYKNVKVTYRDILDDLSSIVGGNIWVNRYTELEIRYPENTYFYDHQLIDFENLEISNRFKVDYEFENDILTINNTSDNEYCYQDISMLFYRNTNKVLRFDYDSITQNQSFAGDIAQLHIYYDDDTMQQITLLTRDKQIYTYTIPSNTDHIIKVDFVLYANNSNTEVNGSLIIDKPYLHFGATKEEYIPLTNDTLDENYLKDVNVNFSDKFGPINKIIISDAEKNIYYEETIDSSIEKNGETAIEIKNNPFINVNNYQSFAHDILQRIKKIQYYYNDITTIGLGYYELLDLFNVKSENKIYPCLLLNSEFTISKGLSEVIYTNKPTESSNLYFSKKETNDFVADTIRARGNAYANGYKLIQENEVVLYSTAETEIGKWIDNKKLYRKVIECGALLNNDTKQVSTGLSNVNYVNYYGIATGSGGTAPYPYKMSIAGNDYAVKVTISNNILNISTRVDLTAYNGYVVIEYTKN